MKKYIPYVLLSALLFIQVFLMGCKPERGGDIVDISTPSVNAATASPVPETSRSPVESTVPATAVPSLPPIEPVTAAPGDVIALNTMPLDTYGVSDAACEAWFSDAVFVGDSITIGWKNYNNTKLQSNPDFFGQTRFLCEGSYGAGHALEPVSESSLHPVFGGKQQLVEDSISQIGANKVFICFGLNDIAIYGIDGTAANFKTLISRILEKRPEADIYIISAMYMYKGSEQKTLNNENLRKLNSALRALCSEQGLEFIDIASHLIDSEGYLKPEYSSDKYVHQTAAAYDIWAKVLRSLAARNIFTLNPGN